MRHRDKLVQLRTGLKAQVHATLAKEGVKVAVSDLFGVGGRALLERAGSPPMTPEVSSIELVGTILTSARCWRSPPALSRQFLNCSFGVCRDGTCCRGLASDESLARKLDSVMKNDGHCGGNDQ